MFLNILEGKEKEMFLDLAVYAAKANGIVEETEKITIDQYCKEMGISFYDIDRIHELKEVVEFFSKSKKQTKRIAILELLGLCYADGDFDDIEIAFSRKFALDIGIKEKEYDLLLKDVEEYVTIISIIRDHVIE